WAAWQFWIQSEPALQRLEKDFYFSPFSGWKPESPLAKRVVHEARQVLEESSEWKDHIREYGVRDNLSVRCPSLITEHWEFMVYSEEGEGIFEFKLGRLA